ncbi:MAG: DUF507 family protein [Acidobacteriota bacterium]
MRLPKPLIDILARRMVQGLMEAGTLTSEHPERTREKVARLLQADLEVEDALTEEARLLLLEHHAAVRDSDAEMHRLLAKVKGELAAKRGYLLSTGPERLSRAKVLDLVRQMVALFLADPDVEYFVPEERLRDAVQRAFERELSRDELRRRQARDKVLKIRRGIPEGSPEFEALFQQFYRELLEKEL